VTSFPTSPKWCTGGRSAGDEFFSMDETKKKKKKKEQGPFAGILFYEQKGGKEGKGVASTGTANTFVRKVMKE